MVKFAGGKIWIGSTGESRRGDIISDICRVDVETCGSRREIETTRNILLLRRLIAFLRFSFARRFLPLLFYTLLRDTLYIFVVHPRCMSFLRVTERLCMCLCNVHTRVHTFPSSCDLITFVHRDARFAKLNGGTISTMPR